MAKRVVIDEDECVGCESCTDLCPDVFEFDQDAEKAKVVKPQGGDEACIDEAIDTCPTECISWEED
jgi:ferredoxin